MKQAGTKFYGSMHWRKLFFFALVILQFIKLQAQCGTFIPPGLFGLSQTSFYCKNQKVEIGVYNATGGQNYFFSLYRNGAEVSRKGGPLDGNGSTLSVAAYMRSAADAGEYKIRSYDACGHSDSVSYYAFYTAIDNLTITAWGNNAVSFKWSASGPRPAVTYEYAVSNLANPVLVPTTFTTTDTVATVSGLTNGGTYYIHVRVKSAVWNGNTVPDFFGCVNTDNFGDPLFPWQTIKFVSCSAAASIGTVSPVNAVICTGGSPVTLTGGGGVTHKWYRDTILQAGQTSATFNATDSGQYRHYITTSTTCQGMVATATITKTSVQTCPFFGSSGDYYAGDTIELGVNNTVPWQTYKILKDGVEVYSMPGIGNPEQPDIQANDTLWYKFVITSAAQAGVYSVRINSPFCTSVDVAGSRTINLITGVTICPSSSTSFTFSSAGNNTIFQWQVDAGAGFNNISNAGVYSGATIKTLTITNAPSTMYGYNYRCVASGGAAVTSSTRTLKFGVAWLGTTSTAWLTPSNWTCGVAPNATTDVIVQAALFPSTNQPVISSNVSCKSVVIKSGCTTCTLKVNTGSVLTITGP